MKTTDLQTKQISFCNVDYRSRLNLNDICKYIF